MASACALAIFSGKNIFIFVVQKRLRAFLNHFFTRGVWERTFPVTYGDKKGSTGTATAVTEGVVFFFFLENATFLQKSYNFFLKKAVFPLTALL